MFNLNSCIEVFGVQVEPQLSVLFAAVNKAVEPLCHSLFSIFAIMTFLVKFLFDAVFEADCHTPRGIDN